MDTVCCVINLHVFRCSHRTTSEVFPRELGFASCVDDTYGVVRFDLSDVTLPDPDTYTADYCSLKIHGLPFRPEPGEPTWPVSSLDPCLLDLWRATRRPPEKTVIGYKGGPAERHFLDALSLPSLNLATLPDCPRFDLPLVQCGFHTRGYVHCAQTKAVFYRNWIVDTLFPPESWCPGA